MEKFNFKKKFGQNFIKDINIVKKIVSTANVDKNTLVIEVGPGMGILTRELVNNALMVVSYEVDLELKDYLDKEFSSVDNLKIIYDDFLKRDISKDIEEYSFEKIYFVANVPYYITTPIMMKIMELPFIVSKIVMMVQKEVGERFASPSGSRDYSSISVYLSYFYNIKKEFIVGKNEFKPVPKVDSIVISLERKKDLLQINDYDLFFRLVRDSFRFKRKNIKNNLKGYDIKRVEEVLVKNNLSLNSRAEEVPMDVFVEMSNNLE